MTKSYFGQFAIFWFSLAAFLFAFSLRNTPSDAQQRVVDSNPQSLNAQTAQTEILGPAGSERFGEQVATLPNGNFIVTDPSFDLPGTVPVTNVGAVYLYNGTTRTLISRLTGSMENDGVGWVTVLPNGNFIVQSSSWHGQIGAVTWCNGTTGCQGEVSEANSLVGAIPWNQVGLYSSRVLANGNYVVLSPYWDNGAIYDVGAATWCNGNTGCVGKVSAATSLVGSSYGDKVGSGLQALPNGHYVVESPNWYNGLNIYTGAATWCNGNTGCKGAVSVTNSLHGTTDGDSVGKVIALSNGNYVVSTPDWKYGLGAVTWCSGTAGCVGAITPANSLVGNATSYPVGRGGIAVLSNGHYVVSSPEWNNGALQKAGAVTWCDGTAGRTGTVTATNSLVGGVANDQVGAFGVTPLVNGNYAVSSPYWSNGTIRAVGAATWCNGTSGCTGLITPANSLVGDTEGTSVSFGQILSLTNGNYVVSSPGWSNGTTAGVGAVTWCNGQQGCRGIVTSANSLTGAQLYDGVGRWSLTALTNGNYVVRSVFWDDRDIKDVGAVTWCNGTTGCTGEVSATNSLIGSQSGDYVGQRDVFALTNGNYVVASPEWRNNSIAYAGAVTWCNGTTGCIGRVSAANSLVGSSEGEFIGFVRPLPNGNYLVIGTLRGVTAFTLGQGDTGNPIGPINAFNSVLGYGEHFSVEYDTVNQQLIAGFPAGNRVILRPRNTAPTIASAANVTSLAGNPPNTSVIATVTDSDQPASTLTVTANGSASATASGVTVSDLSINATGQVSARIQAASNAQAANFALRVTDGSGLFSETTLTVSVVKFSASLQDPLTCSGPGNSVTVTVVIGNPGTAPLSANMTAAFTNLIGVSGSCTKTPDTGQCTVGKSDFSYNATLSPGQTVTLSYFAQVSDQVSAGAQVCALNTVTFGQSTPFTLPICSTVNCPPVGPGVSAAAVTGASDQHPGSLLVYNLFTSDASNSHLQNTRIALTNTHPTRAVFVHLFLVDGSSCAVADGYVCLTAQQTTSFLTADLDPGTTGYLIAVATDASGCPINFNYLIGDAFIKLATGHAANLGAETVAARAGGLPACNPVTSITAELRFDGVSYGVLPRTLALSNVGSRADGNDTLLIVNRIGGNLGTGAATLNGLFGLLYNDAEAGFSLNIAAPACQVRVTLNNNLRSTPRFETVVPAGRTGWLKLNSTAEAAIFGAALNQNPHALSASNAFNQGHNLHKLTTTNAALLTIPVFPPGC